jgi:subtilisin-like proprotein convertase family protein
MTFMKTKHLAVLTVTGLLAVASASAGIITISSGTLDTPVPDGNPGGIYSTMNVSGLGNLLGSGDNVSLTLNISGGNNGDLYAYLSFNGTLVTLLNRPGVTGGNPVGYTDAGFNNVTLSDGNSVNVNSYGGGGVPNSVSYNPAAGSTAFQAYNGMNTAGGWVLFIADMSGGDPSQSVLNSWSLSLDVVPEPVNVALGVFAVLLLAVAGLRRLRRSSRVTGKL